MITEFKIFENFEKRSYYEVILPDLYEEYRKLYYAKNQELFTLLDKIVLNHNNLSLADSFEMMIQILLQHKEIEFVSRISNKHNQDFGRVFHIKSYKSANVNQSFILMILLYDYDEYIIADAYQPVKVYDKKPEIIEYIEMHSSAKKYNL